MARHGIVDVPDRVRRGVAGPGVSFPDLRGACAVLLVLMVAAGAPARATIADDASTASLKRLSIEDLMDIEVTSVSRRPEKWLAAPAAIQVITAEDIRRSGVTSIPAALQLASSLSVAQENAHEWVISSRGFSSDVGNKLLVMIDGRSVYTPLFSGVFWDRQDYVLEDIERIEVISGPGGTLWGANAVNGVINITTKSAAQTQGLYLDAGGGTGLQGFGAVRYGGALSPHTQYRAYAKYFDHDSETFANGQDARDDWRMGQAGFRTDASLSERDTLTTQGDFYRSTSGMTSGGDARVSGANLLGRWTRTLSDTSDLSLQFYHDRTHLKLPVPAFLFAPAGEFKDNLDTYDLDFQHRLQRGARHRFVWGLGFRLTHDVVGNAPALAVFPDVLNQSLYSGFVQDEITLRDDLVLTLGTKVEHTDYTGFELEPSLRMQWSATERHSLWGAVSRAVRTPSRVDRDFSQPAPGYFIVLLQGGSNFVSENLLAYELGYRGQLGSKLSAALSAFYNVYDDLRSTSLSPPTPFPFPLFFENNLEGETHGFELSLQWQVSGGWRLQGGYNLLREDLRVKPGQMDFNNTFNETSDPEHQVSLRSSLDLPHNLELDAQWRWVDDRRVNDAGVALSVPDYAEMDVRLGWRPTKAFDLSIAGRNLLNRRHPEYGLPEPTRVELGRAVHARAIWRF